MDLEANMFGLIKKLIFWGIIALLAYILFTEDGLKNVKSYLSTPEKKAKVTQGEAKDLKKDPWSNVDNKVPNEFDSGYMPDSGIKRAIKKATGTEYGYN